MTKRRYIKPSSQLSILLAALGYMVVGGARQWHTLRSLSLATGAGEATVSANLRHLRKREYGAHVILKRYSSAMRLYEYKLNGGVA